MFKPGDKVRCIRPLQGPGPATLLTKGKIYEVKYSSDEFITIKNNLGYCHEYFSLRFELAECVEHIPNYEDAANILFEKHEELFESGDHGSSVLEHALNVLGYTIKTTTTRTLEKKQNV